MTGATRAAWLVLCAGALAPSAGQASEQAASVAVLGDFAVALEVADDDEVATGERARAARRRAAEAEVAAHAARWRRESAHFLSKKHDYPALAALLDRPYRRGRARAETRAGPGAVGAGPHPPIRATKTCPDDPSTTFDLVTAEGLRFSSRSPRARVPAVQDRFATAYAITAARRARGRTRLSAALARGEPVDFVTAEFDLDRARLDAEIAAARADWQRAPDRAFLLALFGGLAHRDSRYLRDAVTLAFAQHEERLAAGEPARRAEVILSEQVRWLMNALPDRELGLLVTAVRPQLAAVDGDYAAQVRCALDALVAPGA